jgi:hypothetical protein
MKRMNSEEFPKSSDAESSNLNLRIMLIVTNSQNSQLARWLRKYQENGASKKYAQGFGLIPRPKAHRSGSCNPSRRPIHPLYFISFQQNAIFELQIKVLYNF